MVEAFGGSPGLHKGIMEVLVKDTTKFVDPGLPTEDKMAKVKSQVNKLVKAALLISGDDKQ
jgi:hypothetical protein